MSGTQVWSVGCEPNWLLQFCIPGPWFFLLLLIIITTTFTITTIIITITISITIIVIQSPSSFQLLQLCIPDPCLLLRLLLHDQIPLSSNDRQSRLHLIIRRHLSVFDQKVTLAKSCFSLPHCSSRASILWWKSNISWSYLREVKNFLLKTLKKNYKLTSPVAVWSQLPVPDFWKFWNIFHLYVTGEKLPPTCVLPAFHQPSARDRDPENVKSFSQKISFSPEFWPNRCFCETLWSPSKSRIFSFISICFWVLSHSTRWMETLWSPSSSSSRSSSSSSKVYFSYLYVVLRLSPFHLNVCFRLLVALCDVGSQLVPLLLLLPHHLGLEHHRHHHHPTLVQFKHSKVQQTQSKVCAPRFPIIGHTGLLCPITVGSHSLLYWTTHATKIVLIRCGTTHHLYKSIPPKANHTHYTHPWQTIPPSPIAYLSFPQFINFLPQFVPGLFNECKYIFWKNTFSPFPVFASMWFSPPAVDPPLPQLRETCKVFNPDSALYIDVSFVLVEFLSNLDEIW